jgi:hypothetical protein
MKNTDSLSCRYPRRLQISWWLESARYAPRRSFCTVFNRVITDSIFRTGWMNRTLQKELISLDGIGPKL